MSADIAEKKLNFSLLQLEENVKICSEKLIEYRLEIISLEKEKDELKKKLENLEEEKKSSDEGDNLIDDEVSSEIDLSLSQLKDILNLKKR